MTQEEVIIHKWIRNFVLHQEVPWDIVDPLFAMEDGMDFQQYWQYEKHSFDNFSQIFDLDETLHIKIIHQQPIKDNKKLNFIYVFNGLGKIVFKMTITTDSRGRISGNGFEAQIVPKYKVHDGCIKGLAMAIKSRVELLSVVCPSHECLSFGRGANFTQDLFYHAQFALEKPRMNSALSFYLQLATGTEKRQVFFDKLDQGSCPYELRDNQLLSADHNYPVHLACETKDGEILNWVYPRHVAVPLKNLKQAIVTDVLDNDWVVEF